MSFRNWLVEGVRSVVGMRFGCPDCPGRKRLHITIGDFTAGCLRRALDAATVANQPAWEPSHPKCPRFEFALADGRVGMCYGYWNASTNNQYVGLYFCPLQIEYVPMISLQGSSLRRLDERMVWNCGHSFGEYLKVPSLAAKIAECRQHVIEVGIRAIRREIDGPPVKASDR